MKDGEECQIQEKHETEIITVHHTVSSEEKRIKDATSIRSNRAGSLLALDSKLASTESSSETTRIARPKSQEVGVITDLGKHIFPFADGAFTKIRTRRP